MPIIRMIRNGATISPAKPAMAPRQPQKRRPSTMARLSVLGPGMNWQSDITSTNSASPSQRRSSTATRRAQYSTPPKPHSATRRKPVNNSYGVGITVPVGVVLMAPLFRHCERSEAISSHRHRRHKRDGIASLRSQ